MHLFPLIRDLAVILGIAGVAALVFQRIRQPVVLGYLIAGVIVGPHTPPYPMVRDIPNIKVWAELGVIFLMFALGLEFSFRRLARVGASAIAAAGAEAIGMIGAGYVTGKLLGWRSVDALFLGTTLAISSTTIIIKALEELNLKTHRFAELIFGILIVEDLIAIVLLVAITSFGSGEGISAWVVVKTLLQLTLVVGGWFLVGYFALPRFIRYAARRGGNEALLLLSIGLCLSLVVFAASFRYSAALGAFIMGSILAESPEAGRIEKLIAPLRDVFGAVFFVSVGMLLNPADLVHHWKVILLVSAVTIAGKIVTTGLGALVTGQPLRTSVQVGFGLAQIGEFSFIIAGVGLTLGVMSDFIYPIAVSVSILTTFTTPYLIRASGPAAEAIERMLPSRIRAALTGYSAWTQQQRADHARSAAVQKRLLRWALNGLVVSLVFVLVHQLALPMLSGELESSNWARALAWAVAILLSSPFLVAMWKSTILLRLSGVAWVGGLSIEFFPSRYAGLATALVAAAVFARFFPNLERSYRWFESRFLATFEDADQAGARGEKAQALPNLAPWDAHLVRLRVHADSDLTLKPLLQLALRSQYGVNVLAIQRGSRTILPPTRDEVLLPQDELLVLGTDDQVDQLRGKLERSGVADHGVSVEGYDLKQFRIERGAQLEGCTIQESGIREQLGCLVVGLERGTSRMLNPESTEALRAGDYVWAVGMAEKLDRLRDLCARKA